MKKTAVALSFILLLILTKPAGADPPLITLCHNPGPTQVTISVSIAAIPAHLAHGDYLGPCIPWEEDEGDDDEGDGDDEENGDEGDDDEDPTPTNTPLPTPEPTVTSEPTDEAPTPEPTASPTSTPEATDIPQAATTIQEVVWMWLLFNSEGDTCALVDFDYDGSYDAPAIERQLYWCGWIADVAWRAYVLSDNTWSLDGEYLYTRYDLQTLLDLYQP